MSELESWENEEEVALTEEFLKDMPKPMFWRVMVMPLAPKTKSKGGIVIPQDALEQQKHLTYLGKVIAKGPLAFTNKRLEGQEPPSDGEYIVYGRYAGQPMTYKGAKLLLLNDDEILARVPDPDALKVHF